MGAKNTGKLSSANHTSLNMEELVQVRSLITEKITGNFSTTSLVLLNTREL